MRTRGKENWIAEVQRVLNQVKQQVRQETGRSPNMKLVPGDLSEGRAVVRFQFPFRPDGKDPTGKKNELVTKTRAIWQEARDSNPKLWCYDSWVNDVDVSTLGNSDFAERMRRKRGGKEKDSLEEEAAKA